MYNMINMNQRKQKAASENVEENTSFHGVLGMGSYMALTQNSMEFLKNLKVDSGLAADRFCVYIQKKRNEYEWRSLHALVYSRAVPQQAAHGVGDHWGGRGRPANGYPDTVTQKQ